MAEKKVNWLNKLTRGSLKANRIRNIMIIISASIICAIITTTLNAAISVVVSAEKNFTDQLGTTAQCSLNTPSRQQLVKLQRLSYIKDTGCKIDVGTAKYKDNMMLLQCLDDNEWKNHIKPTITKLYGDLPEEINEVVLSKSLLDVIGIQKPYIGKTLTLSCDTTDANAVKGRAGSEQTFVIAGWYLDKRQYNTKTQGIVYVSDQFAAASGKTIQNSGNVYFSFKKNVFIREVGIIQKAFKEPQIEMPSDAKQIKLKNDLQIGADQEVNKVRRTFGYIYNTQSLTPYILIIIPALICGLLLIFDSFYLTIFKDLRECGLLMAVGASLKQLNSILWRQALVLGIAGISAGLLLSVLASIYAVPLYMKNIVGQNAEFVWSFSSFFIAAVITFSAVAISSQVVNVYLGRVSILQSIHGGSNNKNKSIFAKAFERMGAALPKREKQVKSFGIYKLAAKNTIRNIKLNLHVMISLFVAATVILLAGAVVMGINPKDFAAEKLDGHDFILANETFYPAYKDPNYPAGICLQQDVFENSLISDIKQQEGIKKVDTIGFLPIGIKTSEALKIYDPYFEDGLFQLAGLWFASPDYFQKLIAQEEKQKIELDKLNKGSTVLINIMPDIFPADLTLNGYILTEDQVRNINLSVPAYLGPDNKVAPNLALAGKNLLLLFSEGEDNPVLLQVGGYYTETPNENLASVGQLPGIYANYTFANSLDRIPITAQITIDADKAQVENIERYLTAEIGNNSLIDFQSEARLVRTMNATQNAVYIIGYLLAFTVTIIGILEFLNMTMINTQIRRNEFTVLRSIGMSKKQLYRMLATEGIFNSLSLILILATIGNWLIKKLYGVFGYAEYHMPAFLFALVSAGIIILLVPIHFYEKENNNRYIFAFIPANDRHNMRGRRGNLRRQ